MVSVEHYEIELKENISLEMSDLWSELSRNKLALSYFWLALF